MQNKSSKENKISRRSVLPIIGSSLLIPFLSFANSKNENIDMPEDNEEYQTLLKPDGTAVKVKVSTLKKAKIVKKNMSNKSFLNWLGKKI